MLIDSIHIERTLRYYTEGQTLELICKLRYDTENETDIEWTQQNRTVAKNVSLFYNNKQFDAVNQK